MSFRSGDKLWLLLLVLALAAGYAVFNARRQRVYAVRFTNLALLGAVAPRRPGWRRHLAGGLLVLGLATLVVGLARPATAQRIPEERATIMLAIDVSESMAASDVQPNRLAAAQAAAKDFVAHLPGKLKVGLVSFHNSAEVLVTPTTDRAAVRAAIDNLELGPGTAIGEAVFSCLEAIQNSARTDAQPGQAPPPARIVLLTDGERTVGRTNEDAAAAAVAAHVPVSTIAFGTPDGVLEIDGQTIPVPVNEQAMQDLASATDGTYGRAESEGQLEQVYAGIGSQIGYRTTDREIGGWFLGGALAVGLLAGLAGLLWQGRVV